MTGERKILGEGRYKRKYPPPHIKYEGGGGRDKKGMYAKICIATNAILMMFD